MVIYRRKIRTHKTQEDVLQIIQSSAFHSTCKINAPSFSLEFPKRNQKGQIMLVPIKGQIADSDGVIEVTLELQAGVEIWIGLSVLVLELIMMIYHLIYPPAGKAVYSTMIIGFGAIVAVFYWLRGIEVIDLLEHKISQ